MLRSAGAQNVHTRPTARIARQRPARRRGVLSKLLHGAFVEERFLEEQKQEELEDLEQFSHFIGPPGVFRARHSAATGQWPNGQWHEADARNEEKQEP